MTHIQALGLQCPLAKTMLKLTARTPSSTMAPPPPPATPGKNKKKRTDDDDDKPSYADAQLRPKRLKSLASQIPYQLFLKQWCSGGDVSADWLNPEWIEAWCLSGQPRRQDMGEERVRLLAERATITNNNLLPHWFQAPPHT